MAPPDEQVLQLPLPQLGQAFASLRLVDPQAEKLLVQSLKRYGQMSPVVVCSDPSGDYQLLDGFKRLRASQQSGVLTSLRAKVLSVSTRAAKAAMLCLNWTSSSVSALEEGWVVHSLCRNDGLTQLEVGQLLERGQSWVSRRLSLVERLSDEVQAHLRLGLLTSTMGRELARMPRGIQEQMLHAILTHHLTSREVARLVDHLHEASPKESEQCLREPRRTLAALSKGETVVRDVRLSEAGNRLLMSLAHMERSSALLLSQVGLQGLAQLGDGELLTLAPAIGKAGRAATRVSQALVDVLESSQGALDDRRQQS